MNPDVRMGFWGMVSINYPNASQTQSDFLTEVKERELYEEGVKLTKRDPAHFVAVFNKQKGRAKEISKYAVASLHASKLLARQ